MKAIIEESRESQGTRSYTGRSDGATEKSPLLEHRRRPRRLLSDSIEGGNADLENSRVWVVNRWITVEPVVVLFYISFNASVPVMQQFIYDRYARQYNVSALESSSCSSGFINQSDPVYIRQQLAQAASSRMMIGLAMCCVGPALISTLLLGPYSDKAGRKMAMLPALAGEAMRMGVNAAVIWFELPLWVMFISFFIDGVVGSAGGVMMACFAYLSDITTHKQRSYRILILELCMGLGVMASQVGVGHMIAATGFFYPMLTITILNLFNFFYVIFLLPESRVRDPDAKLFSLEHIKKPFMLYVIDDWKERRWKLQILILTFALFTLVELGTNEVTTLYLLNSPLCWDSIFVGYFNGLAFFIKNAGSLLLLVLFYARIGDIGMVLLGFLSGIAYEITLSQAATLMLAFLSPLPGLGMSLVLPMLRSISSKLVEPEEQGSLFATQGWTQLLGTFLGSFFFNTIYVKTLFLVHGLVFMIAAGVLALGLICSLMIMCAMKKDMQLQEDFEKRKASIKSGIVGHKFTLRTKTFM